jgi:surfeit locus 1 family protein
MHAGRVEFRPGRWPTLITIVFLGILVSLGFWQLDRAEQKRILLDQYRGKDNPTVFQLDPAMPVSDDLQYQYTTASGHFDARRQFLLDNRIYESRVGYHVLTPFILDDFSGVAVLVNRGWIPLGDSREQLPNLPVDTGMRELLGRIRIPPQAFTLGEEEVRVGWPYRIQQIDTHQLAGELGYPLLPFVVLLDENEENGFVRDWRPVTFGPERNVGYAVQWFGLALALLILYLAANIRMTSK